MKSLSGKEIKMAKLSKSILKRIVKQCLVEILSEGINTSDYKSSNNKKVMTRRQTQSSSPQRSTVLDSIHFNESVKSSVNVLTDDPIMASILTDTASTTLQEQISAESHRGISSPEYLGSPTGLSDGADPADMFGEASKNWATLAFNDKKIR